MLHECFLRCRRLSVLVIEDQLDIAANVEFLERRGHSIDHAADGQTGLDYALRGNADVIVLDLKVSASGRSGPMSAVAFGRSRRLDSDADRARHPQ